MAAANGPESPTGLNQRRAWESCRQRHRYPTTVGLGEPRTAALISRERRAWEIRGTDKWEQIIFFLKRTKQKEGKGAPLTVTVWSSFTVHTRGMNEEHKTWM